MNLKNSILKFKKILLFGIIFLLFSTHVNFFKSIYLLSFRGYEERMLRTYGWGCDVPNAYQFIKNIIESVPDEEKNFYIHNFHTTIRYWLPPIDSIFLGLKTDETKKKLILLHYYKEHHGVEIEKINVDLREYTKITSAQGCAYFVKND